MKVHSHLGPGFSEKIYEKALVCEFKSEQLIFANQALIRVQYNETILGFHRVDFIIENEVLVELKSRSKIIELFEKQLLSYLKASGKRVGLILNFGSASLQIKRIAN
ncbi:MAG: GxxExxY protein [Planctomycetes bacterium]|nr:GxxExxY protein [Planctomycetota bacterium]